MYKKVMLFSLETFKSTGGIQNMTRTLAYSLNWLTQNDEFEFWSLYDAQGDLNAAYLPKHRFKGFGGKKLFFFKSLFQSANWPDLAIISHINLAVAGLIVKLFNSKNKVCLVAHGIEVWCKLSPVKRALLKHCDRILCVSEFTKLQMMKRHHVPAEKCLVLNNALDPFFVTPGNFEKPTYLSERYQLNETDKVLFTLTRINSAEQYKGYDKVIEAIAALNNDHPNLKYILAGKSDEQERDRLEQLIARHQLQENVILAGFIDDKELTDHFLLADIFVMPSKGEGFGLVLIEAAACGTPVVCGNADGSLDAIQNGQLGTAINPDDRQALIDAIAHQLRSPQNLEQKKLLQQKCLRYFSADRYKENLKQLILNE